MLVRDVMLILLGVVVTLMVLNHPRIFVLYVRLKADGIFKAAERAIDGRALDRVLKALDD